MTEHLFEERGLYYRTNAFVPGRQTLVFVHGVSGSSSAWTPYEARFEHRYSLPTFDIRGHGQSRKYPPCRDYAIARFVDGLKARLGYLAIEGCELISHSFAVRMMLEFLRPHQAFVDGVALLSADFDVSRRWPAKCLRTLLTPVALLEWFPFQRHAGAHVDYAAYPNSGDWNLQRMRADVGNTTWRVFLYCTKQSFAVHADAWLTDIRVPVLLMHGRHDTIFSVDNSRYMATRIPAADLVILDDADHILVLNRSREVGDAIESFVDRISGRRSLTVPVLCTQPTTEVHDRHQGYAGYHKLDDTDRPRHRADRAAEVVAEGH